MGSQTATASKRDKPVSTVPIQARSNSNEFRLQLATKVTDRSQPLRGRFSLRSEEPIIDEEETCQEEYLIGKKQSRSTALENIPTSKEEPTVRMETDFGIEVVNNSSVIPVREVQAID